MRIWRLIPLAALALGACATPRLAMPEMRMPKVDMAALPFVEPSDPGVFEDIGYTRWTEEEPPYLFWFGDEIDVTLPGAPRYNTKVTVQPDGRIALPLIGQVMVYGRSIAEVESEIGARYSRELIQPRAFLSTKPGPLQVFVGGEVGTPKEYALIGDGNALQAVIQAGGFKSSADSKRVIIIRRVGEQGAAARFADLSPKVGQAGRADYVPLRRGDIIYVPRSGVAKVGLFMQQYLRDALPISFNYAINGNSTIN